MAVDTLMRYLAAIGEERWQRAVRVPLVPLVDRAGTQPQTSAGLVIKTGGSTLAKTGAADFYASVTGILVKIAASTDMPALTGINLSAGFFTVACFFVDAAGTVAVAGGTQGATLGAVRFPDFPRGKALVGYLIITYASAFTGGTTPLDTATTVYVSPIGAFDPGMLV